MINPVREEARDIPVLAEVDVLVAGGGVAGCAAAVSAAKTGARTILLERNGCLGGVATASYMANIGNRMFIHNGKQVVRGFTKDLTDRMVEAGAASPDWGNPIVSGCVIDSERLKVVLIEMLQEAGVEVLCHALAARPLVEKGSVTGVFIESKSGRHFIRAGAVVDATGEADLAYQAGAETVYTGGSASTLFKMGNVDADKFIHFAAGDPDGFPRKKDRVRDAGTFVDLWENRGILFFPHGGGKFWKWLQEKGGLDRERDMAYNLDALGMYALKGTNTIVINSNFYRVEDLDIRSLSQKELHAQRMSYYVGDYLIKNVPGFENSHLVSLGVDLGIRTSRRIEGRATLEFEDRETVHKTSRHNDDLIGCVPVLDSKWSLGTAWSNFVCDIPFGILVPKGVDGLLNASGKSVSTKTPGFVRGMSGCMMCGQAAGVSSALSANSGVPPADVPIRDIQKVLLEQDVYLGGKDRLRELGL